MVAPSPDDVLDESSVAEYRLLAPVYDLLLEPFLHPLRSSVCDLAGAAPGRRIVDVACGTGRQLRMLHERGFACTGVDLSSAMLRQARRNSPPAIRYVHGDATHLEFREASFDAAVVSLALHELPPLVRSSILAEMRRVVVPGGLLLVADYLAPVAKPFPEVSPGPFSGRLGSALTHLAERSAGKIHYGWFRDFLGRGGLLGLLSAYDIPVLELRFFLLGTIGLAAARRPD
jgi:ubiquinone/menaquinone biosynthesis C-methylase UbiE